MGVELDMRWNLADLDTLRSAEVLPAGLSRDGRIQIYSPPAAGGVSAAARKVLVADELLRTKVSISVASTKLTNGELGAERARAKTELARAKATGVADDSAADAATSAPVCSATADDEQQWWQMGQVCYHCAQELRTSSLEAGPQPSAALHHRLVDCPKRKQLGEREFNPPSVLVTTLNEFREQARLLEVICVDLEAADEKHKQATAELLAVEGQIQFMCQYFLKETQKPPPPPPAPPPRARRHIALKLAKRTEAPSAIEDASRLLASGGAELRLTEQRVERIIVRSVARAGAAALEEGEEEGVRSLGVDARASWRALPSSMVVAGLTGGSRAGGGGASATAPSATPPSPPSPSVMPFSHAWSLTRGLLLMSEGGLADGTRPITPDDVRTVASHLKLPLAGINSKTELLWLVLDYMRAPLPQGWTMERLADGVSSYSHSLHDTKQSTHPMLPNYADVMRKLMAPGALGAGMAVEELGWMLFSTEGGDSYFYNFKSSQLVLGFPYLGELSSIATPPVSLALDAYQRTNLAFVAARSHTELLLSHGIATPASLEAAASGLRSFSLWLRPCKLAPLLAAAQTLGIDPVRERHYMWLAHLSLCLPLPIGWAEHATDKQEEWKPLTGGRRLQQRRRKVELDLQLKGYDQAPLPDAYYHYSLLGASVVQWERPQVSYCRGVLHALRRRAALHEQPATGADGGDAAGLSAESPPGSPNSKQAEAVKEQTKLMRDRPRGAVFAYATALTGKKTVRLASHDRAES